MNEMAALLAKKHELENKQTVARAEKLYNMSPLAQPDFTAVRYSMADLQFKPKLAPTLLLALAIILGGMFSILILIVRSVLRK